MPPVPDAPNGDAALWHGYTMAEKDLPPPACVTKSDTLARPDYTDVKSAEYFDTPEALDAKADRLIEMWTAAQHPVIYAGAGISTSSGICDYASKASGSKVQAPQRKGLTMSFINSLKPTPAHRVITAMEKKGHVWGWLQQNHDGLAQKAGFPASKVNELHGAWLDKTENPVIKMSGSLRGDLYTWMEKMEEGADFVFAVGTSLSGLTADGLAGTASDRHLKDGRGQGLAIIAIQKTPYDDRAALRVFAPIDDFMLLVATKMKLTLSKTVFQYKPTPLPVGVMREEDWQRQRALRTAEKPPAEKPPQRTLRATTN